MAGFRAGWLAVTGPQGARAQLHRGPRDPGQHAPVRQRAGQYAIQVALGGYQSINELILPGGRLVEQRDRAWGCSTRSPASRVTKPQGALYLFPRLDPKVHRILDDERFAFDLLSEEKLLVVHGTGFNWPTPDHFRIVFLPRVEDLEDAVGRLERFLSTYSQ